MKSTPTSAAIYCRISKDSNGQGLGVDRQRELCSKLAEEKGWTVGAVYVDNDISAYSGAPRPQYEKMLADLAAGTIDGVLTVDQDRLTRQPSELENFIILADRLDVALANVSGDIDLGTSDGRFRSRILGAVSRQESEKKSERHRRQKDDAASKGWHPGGRRPYGYTHARTPEGVPTLEIVESEAMVVREMATRLLRGESTRQIALDLNNRGIATANGKTWQTSTIRNLLTKPSTAGLRQHRGEVIGEGNWQPLIDRATWESISAIYADPQRRQGGTPRVVHVLAGLLACSECGTNLHFHRGAYLCASAPRGCGKISVSAAVEPIVVEQVLNKLAEANIFTAIAEAPTQDVEGIVSEIEAGEQALDQLARDYYSDNLLSRREFLAAREAVEARLADLRAKLPAVHRSVDIDLPGDRDQLAEVWSELSFEDRREILHLVIDKAIVHPGTRGTNTVDPDRVEIKWR